MLTLTPQQTARIKEVAPLAEVVGEYVRLRASGPNRWMGQCPFHNDRSPSFTVHREGFYTCFGCGAKGDVISFVRAKEGVSFPAAVRDLAERYGVSLDDTGPDLTRQQRAQAVQLAAECSWWWWRLRREIAARQHAIVACERRAEAFLAARVADEDSPGIEYAWWWLVNAGGLWAEWQAVLDGAAELLPVEALRVYQSVRGKVRPRYERERVMWGAWRAEMVMAVGRAG